ncbi:three-Cys-motif partner protein TcmP [Methylomicrobium lacus]|uniref:three-Cys-motif partner protein TcmP n=1 Tax=Methylomicrobium lacus TaxID=136992 RepID=UPI00045E7436|nr:three-Cys-motif partner protein TcmP [Methylomicrobium lacus]
MAKKHYEWDPNSPADIDQHSLAKHEILRAYLVNYVQTLISTPYQEELKLTLVDGFSGGGIYKHSATNQLVYGSPIVMLEAIKEAEFLINKERRKKINLKVDYFFVDSDKSACSCLKKVLIDKGYGSLIDKSIFINQATFDSQTCSIIEFVSKKSIRAKRAIFLLDQYGYSDVPTNHIRKILRSLPGAEVIFNFNVDAFLTYASDKALTQNLLDKIGIPNALRGRSINDIKQSEKDWRLFIQSCLYPELVKNCGARYFTPFFIRSSNGHGDYWLVHLSQHHRARDVMTQIHWQKNNYFIHYGDPGLDMFQMLGYLPERDSTYTGQMELGFCFDDPAQEASIDALSHEIPHLVYARDEGISFGELFATTCNYSPASAEIYRGAIGHLIELKEVEVISQNGARRKSPNTIHDKDQIIAPRQRLIFEFSD